MQLRDQPLVLISADQRPGLNARRELTALLEERGLAWRDLRVALELPTDLAVLAAVEAGAGAGLVPRLLLTGWRYPPGGLHPARRALAAPALRRPRPPSPAPPAAAAWWDWREAGDAPAPGSTD